MTHLTFVWAFNAVHRLWTDGLSDAENWKAYGECANQAGHGHQYRLEVTVRLDDDVAIPRGVVDRTINEVLAPALHNAVLDDAFAGDGFISTGENVVRKVWQLLASRSEVGSDLHQVRLIETAKNSFTYRGTA